MKNVTETLPLFHHYWWFFLTNTQISILYNCDWNRLVKITITTYPKVKRLFFSLLPLWDVGKFPKSYIFMQFAWTMLQFKYCLLHLTVSANFFRWPKKFSFILMWQRTCQSSVFENFCRPLVAHQCLKWCNVHKCSLLTINIAGENSQYSSWLVAAVKLVDVVWITKVCETRKIDWWMTIKVLHCLLWVLCMCPKQQCYFENELPFNFIFLTTFYACCLPIMKNARNMILFLFL